MKTFTFQKQYLKKKFPLRISRGLIEGSTNLFVAIEEAGVTGWGEMSPGSSEGANTVDDAQSSLEALIDSGLDDLSIVEIYGRAIEMKTPLCALAALDIALWDLKAKTLNTPLYELLALPLPKVPTSVTLGILPADEVEDRIHALLANRPIKALKVKLGSTEGIEADKSMFAKVIDYTKPYDVALRVDANGGWNVDESIEMMTWLSKRGVEYVEQPLVEGNEDDLKYIFPKRALPIFVDESCRLSTDIPQWASYVDGVNLKLMKCGGITEALRILATAKAFKLKTMIGCMGESSMSISAGAAISGIIDYIDLDSHLNLDPDPCSGAKFTNGVIVPTNKSGHGSLFKHTNT
jgi:muconate cycloisomerase